MGLYTLLVANKQKAIVGFVLTAVAAYFAKYGIDINTLTVKEALELLAYGILGYLGVYSTRNK